MQEIYSHVSNLPITVGCQVTMDAILHVILLQCTLKFRFYINPASNGNENNRSFGHKMSYFDAPKCSELFSFATSYNINAEAEFQLAPFSAN